MNITDSACAGIRKLLLDRENRVCAKDELARRQKRQQAAEG
jgi:hypothetical protein